jgi:uncharacterized membrane protein YgcG
MNTKILLIALSAAALTSCTTAYKSAQTPDDVYYSPARVGEEKQEDNKREQRQDTYTAEESRTRMTIRDRRWRDLNDEYDYSYRYSPYNYSYCNCTCNNLYGYYYNPFYYPRPLFQTTYTYKPTLNSTPRTVNLNGYKNYAQAATYNPKTGSSTVNNNSRITRQRQYNNSNGESRVGQAVRQIFTPNSSNNSNSNSNSRSSSSESNSRTYTPSSSSSSSSSSGSSSSGSSSGSVARPGRGGK